ncbi:MAG: phosphoglucosamine mutase [Halobacteriovoraceae bacterium]|jgi:phosphoglucosamine mutase|nr:phosphoglucosamine mutase [Halobacteriovoraceae bacterium]
MNKRKLFGTDGMRGRANVYPITGEVAFALGRAVTAYFQRSTKNKMPIIIVGKDTRLSCYMLEQSFSAGVCSQGGRVILTGPLPTPGVAFVTQSMRADAGVMISASHNKYYDNGIKIFDRVGHKLPDEAELELEQMVLNSELIPKKLDDELGHAKRLDEVVGRYIVKVKQALSSEYSLEGMRLVIDGANGAAYKVAPMVFQELGAEVIIIGGSPNGTNINEGVGALHPELCAEKVKEYRADLGVCLDGDGDRLVIIDGNGNSVAGDKLIGILGKFLIETNQLGGNKEVVGTVMSNFGLEKFINSIGGTFHRTQVGDRYIVERMLAQNSVFGGEPSGHIIFKSFATTGDGILAALKVIECLKFYGKSLHELSKEITLMPQVLINVKVKDKKDFSEIPSLKKVMDQVEQDLAGSGRVLLRYSGTENLARVMIEGENEDVVQAQCQKIADVLKAEIGE